MPERDTQARRLASGAGLEQLRRVARTSLLIAADEIAMISVVALVLLIGRFSKPLSIQTTRWMWPLPGFLPIVCAAKGLYPGFRIGNVETIRRMASAITFTLALAAAVDITFEDHWPNSLAALIIAWPLASAVLPVVRLALRSTCANWNWWNEPAVIVANLGDPPLQKLIQSAHALGYSIVKTIELADLDERHSDIIADSRENGPPERHIRTAILYGRLGGDLALPRIHRLFRRVIVLQSIPGMPVEHLAIGSAGDLIGIEFSNRLLLRRNRTLKRVLDIVVASVMLALSAPIILLSGMAVKIASSGPMFFRQRRGGLNGRLIIVRKSVLCIQTPRIA
jgi:hypothetical protein